MGPIWGGGPELLLNVKNNMEKMGGVEKIKRKPLVKGEIAMSLFSLLV